MICELAAVDVNVKHNIRETATDDVLAGGPLQDFAFVAIDEHASVEGADSVYAAEVVSWARVDCIAAGVGDAGLFAVERHRRRELATVTAAAAVEYDLSRGLSAVSCTYGVHEIPSVRTAEKLGFARERDCVMYLLMFDEAEYLSGPASCYLLEGDYEQAADFFEQGFALRDDVPPEPYYRVARAWAALDQPDQAFRYLNAAVDKGWTGLHSMDACKESERLRDATEWTVIADRVRRITQKTGNA